MLRRKLLWCLIPTFLASSMVFGAAGTGSERRQAHGDPPYLLEPGWTPLINPTNLDGWQYEHPEKGKWTNSRAKSFGIA